MKDRNPYEKRPLESKKFIAYLLGSMSWKAIVITSLFLFRGQVEDLWFWWFLITTVIVTGFVDVGFLGGQAWLDRYVRVAQITTRNPMSSSGEVSEEEE